MDTKTLVERAMEKTGCSSKNQLATKLGIHSGLVSDWINGKRTPDAAEAGLLAKAAGLDPVKTMFEFEAQHEKNPVKKALWNDLARAAVFFVAVSSFFTTPTPSEGSNGAASGLAAVYYVKSCQKLLAKIKTQLDHFLALLLQASKTVFPAGIGQM